MKTFMKNGNGCFVYEMPHCLDFSRTGADVINEAKETLREKSGIYDAIHGGAITATERGKPVNVVGAALVGDDNRPYFALKCGYDWILVAIDERGRVSQSDMAGLISMALDPVSAVERHNKEWRDAWGINYLELWEETC